MRILFLTERYPPQRGGLARSSRRIAAGLAKSGVETHVMCVDRGLEPGDMDSLSVDGLFLHRLGAFKGDDRTAMMTGRAIELLQHRHPFDALVGMYLVKAGYIAALEARLCGIPSLALARGNDVEREVYRARNHYVTGALRMATAVGCVSMELVARCKALQDRHGIHYTPNSVDSEIFAPGQVDEQLRKKLGLTGPVVGFSGELRFKKGMTHLLMAAEDMAGRFSGIKFLLLGGVRDDDRPEFEKWMENNPVLKDLIVEIPYVDEPEELCGYYRLMDALFMPSFWEGMPNACLEALACGLPVAASTAGGLRELVEHGVNGCSFPPGDYPAALEALSEIVALPGQERKMMGARGREKVLGEYSTDKEIDRLVGILNELSG